MSRTGCLRLASGIVVLFLVLCFGTAGALEAQQSKRIEYLIAAAQQLEGAKFVRNGSEYDGKEAAAHLRLKLRNAGARVRSAEDFIELCATKSYFSGKPYQIVFSGGKTVPSGEFFHQQLRKYDLSVK